MDTRQVHLHKIFLIVKDLRPFMILPATNNYIKRISLSKYEGNKAKNFL